MKFTQRTPCAECPFRKRSMKGWLGPMTNKARELIYRILGKVPIEGGFFIGCEPMDYACHVDLARLAEKHKFTGKTLPDKYIGEVQHCVGALLILKADHKLPHDRKKVAAMDKAKAKEPMISSLAEFVAHHGTKDEKVETVKL